MDAGMQAASRRSEAAGKDEKGERSFRFTPSLPFFTRSCSYWLAVMSSGFLLATTPGCVNTEKHTAYKPYVLNEGMWSGSFAAGFVEVRAATVAALTELKMPVVREERTYQGSYLDTQTQEGYHVRIHFRSPAKLDGSPVTHVAVRVGGFGTHEQICSSLLDEIGHHLGAVSALPVTPPASAMVQSSATVPAAPAPTLPPQPIPVAK